MAQTYTIWDGEDWQRYINTLLGMRFQIGQYQQIPDRDRGDCGLEGFSFDGIAFQCYAAEEPLEIDALTEKQNIKITRDIRKLCDNHLQIAKLLGTVRLHTWVLMVPRCDSKRVVAHAAAKTEEVRAKKLPILTDEFRISVQDDTAFSAQKNALSAGACEKIPVVITNVAPTEVTVWATANTPLIATLDQKLGKLGKSPGVQERLRARMVKHFLDGQNALQYLHANYPNIEEHVRRCKEARERVLETESLYSSDLPETRLKASLDEYKKELISEIGGVTPDTAEVLAHEAAADWLLRCPLDFTT